MQRENVDEATIQHYFPNVMKLYVYGLLFTGISTFVFCYQRFFEIEKYFVLIEAFLFTTVYCLKYHDYYNVWKLCICQVACTLMNYHLKFKPVTVLIAILMMLKYKAFRIYLGGLGTSYLLQGLVRQVLMKTCSTLVYFEYMDAYENDFTSIKYVPMAAGLLGIIYFYFFTPRLREIYDAPLIGIVMRTVLCISTNRFVEDDFNHLVFFLISWSFLKHIPHNFTLMHPFRTLVDNEEFID